MIKAELNPECGKRLKQCLEESFITQADLAETCGFTQQYISNIVTGKKPMTIKAASLFSDALGIRQEYLLCKDDDKRNDDYEKTQLLCSSQVGLAYLWLLNACNIRAVGLVIILDNGVIVPLHCPDYLNMKLDIDEEDLYEVAHNQLIDHPHGIDSIKVCCDVSKKAVFLSVSEFRHLVKDINDYIRFKCYDFLQSRDIFNEEVLSYGDWFDSNVILQLMRREREANKAH